MKFRTLRNWEKPEELEGVVFFSQMLDELLFPYSLDTYKPSAMNTSTLCIEARNLIKDIENELIDAANLPHVIKELALNLKKDEVALDLLDIDHKVIEDKLIQDNTSIAEKKTVLEILYSQINLLAYKERTEDFLMEAVKDGHGKDRIRALTRSYITTLIALGYSSRFLYPASRHFFHWGKHRISSFEDLKLFFGLVSGKKHEYKAIFKSAPLFDEIKESCKAFRIEIRDALEDGDIEVAKKKNFELVEDSRYLIVTGIKVMDVFSARDFAERRIEQISTLVNLFHHKEIPSWESNALLINLDTEKARIISSTQNPMLMCSDLRTPEAATKLNCFINEFKLRDRGSLQKFFRAAELHSLALRSDSPENQLLNLWVALETLAPSKLGRNKAKVNNIIDSILPFLSLNYIHSLTDWLTRDIRRFNKGLLNKTVENVEGEDDSQKLIRVLLLEEHEDKKLALLSELGDFHLLRNRVHYFSTCLSTPKKIARLLESHWTRVDWQIRRIYRTRNQIVHAGYTPRYVDVLIKNIHDYLDIVIRGIGKLASKNGKFNTNDQIFKYAEIKYQEYIKLLNSLSTKIDSSNISQLVLEKQI